MPVYFFWGEDEFSLELEVKRLKLAIVDSNWQDFNFSQINGEDSQAHTLALAEVMTPAFGTGARLVWVKDSNLAQQCSQSLLDELKRVLPAIGENGHLLLTSTKKPDSRLKSTKFLQTIAEFKEFSLLSAWKTEEIAIEIKRIAQRLNVNLTNDALDLLVESLGNDSRSIWSTLEKLSLYQLSFPSPLSAKAIAPLVNISSQNSLQLALALREGKTSQALTLVDDLLSQNEPALRIVATLVGQFRTWAWIKLQIENGEKDEAKIASSAGLNNPKRLYFLKQEIQSINGKKLTNALSHLLELEYGLKRGNDPLTILQSKVIEICQIFNQKK
ncbi:MAG: DNA polymerase III subunit delta [Cyanobacteriota bacterium ELA615]